MILFDGIIFRLQRSGGISVLFSEILSRLPEKSYTLIGYRTTPPPTVPVGSYHFRSPRYLERWRLAPIDRKFDIFHSTYYRLPSAKGKVVTTVHDYTYERFASGFRRAAHTFQKNRAIAGSDRIICVSDSTRRDLIEFSGPSFEDRTVVIHNGTSDDYFVIPEIVAEAQIIFVGERAGYKNFRSLVHALSGLPDISLACVGGGAFSSIERQFLERHIRGRYRHTGHLSNAELNVEYNRSLCLVYPSLYEGFGIPVIEAMRAGCPVVAVGRSSIPEVAGDAAILMKAGDPGEIRQAIDIVMGRDAREDLVKKGRTQATRFSWNKTYEKTLNVYQELSGKSIS